MKTIVFFERIDAICSTLAERLERSGFRVIRVRGLYAYTVTSLNAEGKESPIVTSSSGGPAVPGRPSLQRRGRLKG